MIIFTISIECIQCNLKSLKHCIETIRVFCCKNKEKPKGIITHTVHNSITDDVLCVYANVHTHGVT